MPEPSQGDKCRLEQRVYLLGTRKYVNICVSKQNTVEEIIKHIITVCVNNPALRKDFFSAGRDEGGVVHNQKILTNPDAYELRLLDDDEDEYYVPLYEISSLDRLKRIGDFEADAIAFCRVQDLKVTPAIYNTTRSNDLVRHERNVFSMFEFLLLGA